MPDIDLLLIRLHDADRTERALAAKLLGEHGDERAICPLCDALRDDDWHVRSLAANALCRVGDGRAVRALCDALQDPNWTVRPPAAKALGRIADPGAVEALARALNNDFWIVRAAAAEALGRIHDPRARVALQSAVNDADEAVRLAAAEALANDFGPRCEELAAEKQPGEHVRRDYVMFERQSGSDDPSRLTVLVDRLTQSDAVVSESAAMELAAYVPDGIALLTDLLDRVSIKVARVILRAMAKSNLLGAIAVCKTLKHSDESMRNIAADALVLVSDRGAVLSLCAVLVDGDPYVRSRAAVALGSLGDERAIQPLFEALKNGDDVSQIAAAALCKIGQPAVPFLCEALQQRSSQVREYAVEALVTMPTIDKQPVLDALSHGTAYVRCAAAEVLARLGDDSSIVRLCAAYNDGSMSVRIVIGHIIAVRDPDRLVFAILCHRGSTGPEKLDALNAVLEQGNRRRAAITRPDDIARWCRSLVKLEPASAVGASAVLAELDRRKAGKTLLRPGTKTEEPAEGSLLRAAAAVSSATSPEELVRAAERSAAPAPSPKQSLFSRLIKRLHADR